MQILIKKGNPSDGQVLDFAAEQAMKQRIQDLENEAGHKEIQQGLAFEPKDIPNVEKKLAHFRKMQEIMGAVRFNGKERDDAEVEIRRLEQRMAQFWGGRFPTYDEYWINQKAGMRYLRLRDTIVKTQKSREYGELMKRWKYLKRRMEPEDPNADNVLQLFDRAR